MPILLRKRETLPRMQPDNTFIDVQYATIAFIGSDGVQVSQVRIEAAEVEGIADGTALKLVEGEPHGLTIPEHHAEMILPAEKVEAI